VGIKEQATRATASAITIAAATSGLTNCDGTGAVDPAPPPLLCDSVGAGQTLQAQATLVGADTVAVDVMNVGFYYDWAVDSVTVVNGGAIQDLVLPQENTANHGVLSFRLVLDEGSTSAVFRVYATTSDLEKTCPIFRQFTVSSDGSVATVTLASKSELPLSARHGVAIQLLAREGRVVTLEARTGYPGPKETRWSVSAGEVTPGPGDRVAWTLPETHGIHQAEVVLDFGTDGVAFDAFAVEVSCGPRGPS
jgi:hypothetical protein